MAYLRRTQRSGGHARRRCRRPTVGYGRRKDGAQVRSTSSKGTLEAQSLGEATNTVFDSPKGVSVSFFASGDRQGQNYWEIPVSAMLGTYMEQNTISKLHLTGIALEGDVYANADIEVFAMNILGTLSTPSPVQIYPEDKRFQFGYGDPSIFGRADNPRVKELTSAAFGALARDGSLFGAPLHSDKSSRSMVCETRIDGGKPIRSNRGRSALHVPMRPVGASMASSVQKKTIRWFWPLRQPVKVVSAGEKGVVPDYNSALFMGVRPKTEMSVPGLKNEQGASGALAGWMQSFRVTLTFRHKLL